MNSDLEVRRAARERGICPRCKDGNGRVWDGAGSRESCDACQGKGTWEAYRLQREFVRGWNGAVEAMRQRVGWITKDMP